MKLKFFTLIVCSFFMSYNSFSQTIKENIDKAAKDKSNVDRAAKADVLMHKKVITTDTTVTKITPVKVVTKPVAKRKKKYYSSKQKKKIKTS